MTTATPGRGIDRPHDAPRRRRRRAGVVVALAALMVPLTACSDGGGSEETPEDVLAAAKEALDETSGVTLSLSAAQLPDDVDGVLRLLRSADDERLVQARAWFRSERPAVSRHLRATPSGEDPAYSARFVIEAMLLVWLGPPAAAARQ